MNGNIEQPNNVFQEKKDNEREKLLVLSEDTASELRKSIKMTITTWHDKEKPDYVFLTETRATPFGCLIKEAWKVAYPNEKTPKFYRIDPLAFGAKDFERKWQYKNRIDNPDSLTKQKISEYFAKRIKDKNAKIVVFDEHGDTGESLSVALGNIERYLGEELQVEDFDKKVAGYQNATRSGYEGEHPFMFGEEVLIYGDIKVTKKDKLSEKTPNDELKFGLMVI